jgi:hypothetical protein
MPTVVYISAAIILLVLAFLNDYKSRERRFLDRDDAVSLLIRQYLNKVKDLSLVWPLDIELEISKIEKYKKMQREGASVKELRKAIEKDAELFLKSFPEKLEAAIGKPDQRNLMDVDPQLEEYERLIRERAWTPKGVIAAHFEIFWEDLVEEEFDTGAYVTDVNSGHTWKVPFKQFGRNSIDFRIMEIDENRKPVATHFLNLDDVNADILNNGEYITEIYIKPTKPSDLLF